MSDSPTVRDFLEVQDYFGLPSVYLVEKDWHVVRAMRAIAAVDDPHFQFVFAGGTCLARAHRVGRRMSEDIDYKLAPIADVPASKTQRRKQLGSLRAKVTEQLKAAGFAVDETQVRSRDDNHYLLYQLPYRGLADANSFLRPEIQVELTFAPLRLSPVLQPMSSFVAEAFKRPPEIPSLACTSIAETAAEKLVSITRRTAMELAERSRNPDPTLVRHLYDLHALRHHIDAGEVGALARRVARSDAAQYQAQYPAYATDTASETQKALSALTDDPHHADRYAAFVAAMVYGDAPTYTQALATLLELATAITAE